MKKRCLNNSNNCEMDWIYNIKKCEKDPNKTRWIKCEVVSRAEITGRFNYKDHIKFDIFMFCKDASGYYHYLLEIKERNPVSNDWENAKKDGYLFPKGMIIEILSIFSLYFKASFTETFQYRDSFGSLTKIGRESLKEGYADEDVTKRSFSDKNLKLLFDKLFNLKNYDQKKLMYAIFHYSKSLTNVMIDPEIGYLDLVTAVEVLSQECSLSKKECDKIDESFKGICVDKCNKDAKKLIDKWKKELKIKQKFINFLRQYKKVRLSKKENRVSPESFSNLMGAIYDARSKKLHAGEPMHISNVKFLPFKADMEPGGETIIGRKIIAKKEKIPSFEFFERIVQSCLIKFIDKAIKSRE